MIKKYLLFLLFYLVLIFATFQSLITHLSTNMIDWLDYPTVVWIIHQDIIHITTLSLGNFFGTNAFYPHPYTLLFADTFLPQALIELPFYILTKNPILSFNILFIITLILNFLSLMLFWKRLIKDDLISLLGSLSIIFSPFLILQLSHFQMLSYWPFFFCFYFILTFDHSQKLKSLILAGVFLAIQFLASVYLTVFLITSIVIFYLLKIFFSKDIIRNIKPLAVILLIFLIIDGVFIKGYFDMQKYYSITRGIREYINYSAQPSDYLFTANNGTLLYKLPIFAKWDKYNAHLIGEKAAFPGVLVTILAILGLFYFDRKKDKYIVSIYLDYYKSFFLLLIIIGFTFSLGPRISFNGNYAQIPTFYSFLIKIPIFESIRALARWSFLLYLGVVFLALRFISTIFLTNKRACLNLVIISLVFLVLEFLPFNTATHAETYISIDYQILKNLCQNKPIALLELPVTHLSVFPGVVQGLNYISKVELSSTYHQCNLVNGYSGYDLPTLSTLSQQINTDIDNQNPVALIEILKKYQVNIVKVNEDKFNPSQRPSLDVLIKDLNQQQGIKPLSSDLFLIQN